MRILLAIVFLLASYSLAEAQKTCAPVVPATTPPTQTCNVTVTITGLAPPYRLQTVIDGVTTGRNITASVFPDTFIDAGNTMHVYEVLDGTFLPKVVASASWTTPAIAVVVPPPPVAKNYLDITTDRTVNVTRCQTNNCAVKLQVQKDTKLKINGVAK